MVNAPKEVVLWFTQKLEPAFGSIEVRNERGASVTTGKAAVMRRSAGTAQPCRKEPTKFSGAYCRSDTHRTQGDFSFHVGP